MTLQDSINRIEELLRALKATDPTVQKAWEAVTEPCPEHLGWDEQLQVYRVFLVPGCYLCRGTGRLGARNIIGLPKGMVRGLLIGVAFDLGIQREIASDDIEGAPMTMFGYLWNVSLEALAAALVKALEDRSVRLHVQKGE